MKKYVFFALSIARIGGGQLYLNTKLKYLNEIGYETFVFSVSDAKILIPSLVKFEDLTIPELGYYPSMFKKGKVEKILTDILEKISFSKTDEVIIESNALIISLWAELLARKIGGKHIVFSLVENNILSNSGIRFLEFKAKRREYAVINYNCCRTLFEKSQYLSEQTVEKLRPYLDNSSVDYEDERLSSIELQDKNICLIGRGEKNYIWYAGRNLKEFCLKNPSVNFCVAVVGIEKNSRAEGEFVSLFEGVKNVKLCMLGVFVPIPKKLFTLFDLYIGGSGCATLPYREGALSLAMNVYEDSILGLMGYDVLSSLDNHKNEKTFEEVLNDALFIQEYKNRKFVCAPALANPEVVYGTHQQFIKKSSNDSEFFDTFLVKADGRRKLKLVLVKYFPWLFKLLKRHG